MTYFASIVGLLKTILIILLVYLGLKSLARIFSPLLLRYVARKAEQRFGGNFQTQGYSQKSNRPKEGETIIDKVPNTAKKSNKDVGEYIDFEEVE